MNPDLPVTFQNVSKRYTQRDEDFLACRNLNFSVAEGETIAIVGETGCGKSTAMQMLLGLQQPSEGRVQVLGCDPFKEFDALRGQVGIVFQTDRLLPWRTASQNIQFGLQVLRIPKARRRRIAGEWLERLGLSQFADAYPHQLSGGMRQRVAIARTFAIEPRVLLADEAFSALDEITASVIRVDLLRLVREQRTTTIFITHSVPEAAEVAERVLVFGRPGQVVKEVNVRDLSSREEAAAEIRIGLQMARAESRRCETSPT
ncbi:ABC transporter ATP-binding protein [Aquabacter spiritensis]|uniref:NitT/TauT family transport system ATP-binding protein n=1 Tax=Aquabacter spiritensis TaxID=933073 RepID=A0A4R3M101_9HYPH|nr:ABC transporter ATP-binding protein [Aquabacter spiritensis]TCT06764.1 NitT/TauT family transport system ATP-binding protein [Aquabacter spiritensis]